MHFIVLFVANTCILFSGNAQFGNHAPKHQRSVSFGLGPGWVNEMPGILIEGAYRQMLGKYVLTSVTFDLNASRFCHVFARSKEGRNGDAAGNGVLSSSLFDFIN